MPVRLTLNDCKNIASNKGGLCLSEQYKKLIILFPKTTLTINPVRAVIPTLMSMTINDSWLSILIPHVCLFLNKDPVIVSQFSKTTLAVETRALFGVYTTSISTAVKRRNVVIVNL